MGKERNRILRTPKAGWSKFLYHEDMRVSYIDDVPNEILDKLIASFRYKRPFCMTFDAEGYDYTILSYDTFDLECILRKEEEPIIFLLPDNLKEFANKIIFDIEKDLFEWARFPCSIGISLELESEKEKKIKNIDYDFTKSEIFLSEKAKIERKLIVLKSLLEKK